jgi:hypothetical protein
MLILAIDPGNEQSAYALIDEEYRPARFGKIPNEELRKIIFDLETENFLKGFRSGGPIKPTIEMIGHYGTGMAAGKTVYDTCIWIGRFTEILGSDPMLILRKTVVTHICGNPKAKDSNVTQALVDRFAYGVPNYGKGTKKAPGWFYGFSADVWQAYALAVTYMDMLKGGERQ